MKVELKLTEIEIELNEIEIEARIEIGLVL